MFGDKFLNIINSSMEDSKIILQGPTGCGKSSIMVERYKYMVDELGAQSDKILVLVPNGQQGEMWKKKAVFKASGRVWISTYYSFIKDELSIYYPKILGNCPGIQKKSIKPVFLPYDVSRYLIAKVVGWHREKKGAFSNITSSSDRIASDLIDNLLKAAASDIPMNEITARLYNSLPVKESYRLETFEESEKILDSYKSKCISLGLFDFGMAVETYNSCLLSDEDYRKGLLGRVRHLIIDNIEECFPVEIDFAQSILPHLKTCLIGYNNEREFVNGQKEIDQYIHRKFSSLCKIVKIEQSYTCSSFMSEFSEMLFSDIRQNTGNKHKNPMIERGRIPDLRSEMLENIGERICGLVQEEGYAPGDIVVLSTFADPVTEAVISNIVKKKNIKIKNVSRKRRVIDNEINFCMVTMARLCYPSYAMAPSCESVGILVRRVLKLDPVRASLLAKEIYLKGYFPYVEELRMSGVWGRLKAVVDMERYKYLREWFEFNREQNNTQGIDCFFYKAFLELFMSDSIKPEEIREVWGLIRGAEGFVEALSKFPNMNPGKGLLEVLAGGMYNNGIIDEAEDTENDFVIMATPRSFISGCYNKKVIILSGISSKNWVPRLMKELTNPVVINKGWDLKDIYTEELEEENQRLYAASAVRSLVKMCGEKLIVFESRLSADGYENDGILAEYL